MSEIQGKRVWHVTFVGPIGQTVSVVALDVHNAVNIAREAIEDEGRTVKSVERGDSVKVLTHNE